MWDGYYSEHGQRVLSLPTKPLHSACMHHCIACNKPSSYALCNILAADSHFLNRTDFHRIKSLLTPAKREAPMCAPAAEKEFEPGSLNPYSTLIPFHAFGDSPNVNSLVLSPFSWYFAITSLSGWVDVDSRGCVKCVHMSINALCIAYWETARTSCFPGERRA